MNKTLSEYGHAGYEADRLKIYDGIIEGLTRKSEPPKKNRGAPSEIFRARGTSDMNAWEIIFDRVKWCFV